MDEINTKPKTEAIFAKAFCALTCAVGCLVLMVAPFFVPFVKMLGFLGTVIFTGVAVLLMTFLSVSGFSYAAKAAENKNYPISYSLLIYMTSFTALALSLALIYRLVAWMFGYFLGIHIDWTFVPPQ